MTLEDELARLAADLSGERWRTTHPDAWTEADWHTYRATPGAIWDVFESALRFDPPPDPPVAPAVAWALLAYLVPGALDEYVSRRSRKPPAHLP